MSKLNKLFNNRNINKKDKSKVLTGKGFKVDSYTIQDLQDFINDVGIEDKEIEHILNSCSYGYNNACTIKIL